MKYLLMIIAIVFLASCKNKKTHDSGVFEIKEESKSIDNLEVDLKYPVFKNDFVNQEVKQTVESLTDNFEKDVSEEPVSENWKNEQSIRVEVFKSSEGYVSLLFYNYLYTGGAHGNTMLTAKVLDSKKKEVLGLNEVLNGSYFSKLQALARKQLKDKLGEEAFIDEGTETVSDFSVFVLSNDSIIFYFPHYQVAAYSYGIQKAGFPLNVFN